MKASEKDRRRGHNDWMSTLDYARQKCGHAVLEAQVDVADPDRVFWPPVSGQRMSKQQRSAAKTHALVINYADQVEPYRDHCYGLWSEQIAEYEFPDGEIMDICLKEINSWAHLSYAVTEWERHELTGREKVEKEKRVYLPVKYARRLYRQLNDCVKELDQGLDVVETDNKRTKTSRGVRNGQ